VLPSGAQTYRISQDGHKLPRIVEASIDPLDVHVGETQTLAVVIEDAESVMVEARITTDHATKVLPLAVAGPVTERDLSPEEWAIDGAQHLVARQRAAPAIPTNRIAYAADAGHMRYEARWIVRDTHDAKYHTTFLAKDGTGHENSITLAWSDACGIPNGGDWNLQSNGNCTLSSSDGVDNGNAIIATYTLTLNSGVTFAWNPGKSIAVSSGGAIAIGSGAQMKQTYLWKQDADGDAHPAASQLAQDTSPGAGWARRNTYGTAGDDCNDSNIDVFPGQTSFFSAPATISSDYDYNCDSVNEQQSAAQFPGCGSAPPNCDLGPGWSGSVPSCGQSGTYHTACFNAGSICNTGSVAPTTQTCR